MTRFDVNPGTSHSGATTTFTTAATIATTPAASNYTKVSDYPYADLHQHHHFASTAPLTSAESFKLRSEEPVPGFSSASPWPTLELGMEWGRKLYPSAGPRSAGGLMFSLPPTAADMNQPRGPMTSLKEEPLGGRWAMQPVVDQTK
ncbi:hypothetical protein ACLKA6_019994 [Drosophila palustris]